MTVTPGTTCQKVIVYQKATFFQRFTLYNPGPEPRTPIDLTGKKAIAVARRNANATDETLVSFSTEGALDTGLITLGGASGTLDLAMSAGNEDPTKGTAALKPFTGILQVRLITESSDPDNVDRIIEVPFEVNAGI